MGSLVQYNNFRDSYGFISITSSDPGNARLYTSEAYLLGIKNGQLGAGYNVDFEEFLNTIRLCEVRQGLYCRHPVLRDQEEQHDNDMGMIAALTVIRQFASDPVVKDRANQIVQQVCAWGLTHKWCYNVRKPDEFELRCMRQPSHVAFIKMCAGYQVSLVEMAWLSGMVMMAILDYKKSSKTQTVLLSKMMLLGLKSVNKMSWLNSTLSATVSISNVANIYFGNHPLADAWRIADHI